VSETPSSELFAFLYDRLRGLARRHMSGERRDHTLSATALVHEAFIKLAPPDGRAWASRGQFYAAAVQAMRRILIDHAKSRGRSKRGGKRGRVPLDAVELAVHEDPATFLSLDEALCRLSEKDGEFGEVARLRIYAGLELSEIARVLGVSLATVKRRWEFARTWLFRELGDGKTEPRP